MILRHSLLHSMLLSSFCCCAYKILVVFPVPTRSHSILGEGFVKYLSEAGHEITYITPFPMKNPSPAVRQIDVSENMNFMQLDQIFDTRSMMMIQEQNHQYAKSEVGILLANITLHTVGVQTLLNNRKEEFDAVIVEWLHTEIYSGLSAVFNCPLIWFSSMGGHPTVLSLISEYPNPAYNTHYSSKIYGFKFWHRVYMLWLIFQVKLSKWKNQRYETEVYTNIFEKVSAIRGRKLPPYDEVSCNGSLLLGNSYISAGDAVSLPQNYKAIGGFHIPKEIDPLPQDLQKLMDNAKHGVIYFSMGSILKSSRIPEHLKKDLLKMFASLNQTVIWKLEEVLEDLPNNVYILPWVPQTSILAHPKCLLFISHGGLLSKLEALHFGIPFIGVPLYADQFLNINRAEARGFGKRVDLHLDGAKKLGEAIQEVLKNPSYRERIKEYSFIYHHRPVPAEKELVHWVEHVIKTRGAVHLRSPGLQVAWYQKYYVDLAAVVVVMIFVFVRLCKLSIIFTRRYLKEKSL